LAFIKEQLEDRWKPDNFWHRKFSNTHTHPPTLAPVFASLDQEMDLMVGRLNFHVGSLGSLRLSGSIYSDPSANKTAGATPLGISTGSSSEVNSPVSTKSTERKRNIVGELDNIMENLG
jgi:hypothetical protein